MSGRRQSGGRKAEILAATLDLAFEIGPDHVSTTKIAARLGLSQPAIYKHFPRKEDIWLMVSEQMCARMAENAAACSRAGPMPLDRVRQLVLSHLSLVTQMPALPEIMVTRDPTGSLTKARGRIQAAMVRLREAITEELDRARAAGQLRAGLSPQDGVTLLFGIIQSLVLRLIVTRDPTPIVQDGERLLDLQLALFASAGDDI